MQLQIKHLQELCDIAIDAANKAGRYIFSNHKSNFEIKTKKGVKSKASQVVTEVDYNSQKIILDTLKESISKYDLGVLTEESEDTKERLEKDYFWCIDPLDGTLPFTEGKPGYSVSISLISKAGIPVIGIVYDPVHDDLYYAIKNLGAFRNNKKWALNTKENDNLYFYYNRSFKNLSSYNTVIEYLENYAIQNGLNQVITKQAGGAIMNAITALDNNPSCFFAFPKKDKGGGSFWDYASTACIYNELNLHVSDIIGQSLNFNNPDSTFMNHCGVLYTTNNELSIQIQELYKRLFS